MGDGIDLDVAQVLGIRRIVSQRNMLPRDFAGLGRAPASSAVLKTGVFEQPIQGGGAHGQKIAPRRLGLRHKRQPQRQRRLKQLAAGLVGQQPDLRERWPKFDRIIFGLGPRPFAPATQGTVKEARGELAVIAAHGAELIEDFGLMLPPGPLVAAVDALQIIALSSVTMIVRQRMVQPTSQTPPPILFLEATRDA